MQATRTTSALAALATLAALGLAAQPAARAATGNSLTLNYGDVVTVSGTAGHIGATLYTPPNTMTTITAGSANQAVLANGASGFTLGTGGTLKGGTYGLYASPGSTVTVSGGAISGTNYGLDATSGGTINLFSQGDTPFLINGKSMNNITLAHYTSGTDTISGTLLDGETLSTHFYDNGTINLNVGTPPGVTAPEPSQTAALALGALGLAALALRARRRRAA